MTRATLIQEAIDLLATAPPDKAATVFCYEDGSLDILTETAVTRSSAAKLTSIVATVRWEREGAYTDWSWALMATWTGEASVGVHDRACLNTRGAGHARAMAMLRHAAPLLWPAPNEENP